MSVQLLGGLASRALRRAARWSAGSGSPFGVFLYEGALEINEARLSHLASLELDLAGRRVLEVGAGIGLLTRFFESSGCSVVTSDARRENVAELKRRFPHRRAEVIDLDDPAGGPLYHLGEFDVVFCYGTLYHVSDPEGVLRSLARVCRGTLLLETVVALGNCVECHRVREPGTNNQAVSTGCRPTRRWVMEKLGQTWGHAYATRTQPAHPEFPTDWNLVTSSCHYRSVFVGSKTALSNRNLLPDLPVEQPAVGGG